MRFPTMFRRRVGELPEDAPPDDKKLPKLGSDEPPEGKPKKADNFHTSRLVNFNGFPSQRVAVGAAGPKEARGRRVPVEVWMHEERTDAWFLVPGPSELRVGTFAYFDAPCLLDHGKGRSDDDSHTPGDLGVVVVPALPVGPPQPEAEGASKLVQPALLPDGLYSFVVGTDVSNPGC
jgi:hypothetical protein